MFYLQVPVFFFCDEFANLLTTDLFSGLEAGDHCISMGAKSTKANDTGSVFYNVMTTLDASVASALEMPMAAVAHADSVQDKFFGESTNGLLA